MGDIIIINDERYELDPRFENSMDVVVQHMIACDFEKQFIKDKLRVSDEFIEMACTPMAKTK